MAESITCLLAQIVIPLTVAYVPLRVTTESLVSLNRAIFVQSSQFLRDELSSQEVTKESYEELFVDSCCFDLDCFKKIIGPFIQVRRGTHSIWPVQFRSCLRHYHARNDKMPPFDDVVSKDLSTRQSRQMDKIRNVNDVMELTDVHDSN